MLSERGAPDTRDGKGACLVSGAPRSLFTTPKKPENITPVLEAMRGETWRKGRNNLFSLRVTFVAVDSRISVALPSLRKTIGYSIDDLSYGIMFGI